MLCQNAKRPLRICNKNFETWVWPPPPLKNDQKQQYWLGVAHLRLKPSKYFYYYYNQYVSISVPSGSSITCSCICGILLVIEDELLLLCSSSCTTTTTTTFRMQDTIWLGPSVWSPTEATYPGRTLSTTLGWLPSTSGIAVFELGGRGLQSVWI